MRTVQWVMIAVGGLGAYAVYRLVTGKPSEPKPEDTPVLTTPPGPSGQPGQPAAPLFLLQNILGRNIPGSALLHKDTPYRGRFELTAPRTREQIARDLQAIGFGDVRVYTNLAEAQTDDAIPLPGAIASPTPGSRWFQATWRGPSGTRALPRELVLLWPTTTTGPGTGSWYIPRHRAFDTSFGVHHTFAG